MSRGREGQAKRGDGGVSVETVPSVSVLLMYGFRNENGYNLVDAGLKWGREDLDMKTLMEFDLRYVRRKTRVDLGFCARLPEGDDGSRVFLEKM